MSGLINHFHLFCGSGSGAAGFNDARPEIPGLQGRMVCLGGMDVDPVGAEDFKMLTGVPCTVRDLFSRQQYVAWHGNEPPASWVEAGREPFRMHGTSDQVHREHIGNAVPRRTAQAIGEEIGRTILLARNGETFQLSSTPIWVRPVAEAIAVRGGAQRGSSL